jgi:hypothetical protein
MSKKILFLLPAIAILIAGCGSKESDDTTTSGGAANSTTTASTGGAATTAGATGANTQTPPNLPPGASGAPKAQTGGHFVNPNGEGNLSSAVGSKSGGH